MSLIEKNQNPTATVQSFYKAFCDNATGPYRCHTPTLTLCRLISKFLPM